MVKYIIANLNQAEYALDILNSLGGEVEAHSLVTVEENVVAQREAGVRLLAQLVLKAGAEAAACP